MSSTDTGSDPDVALQYDLDQAIMFGGLRLVPSRRQLTRDGKPVSLGGRAMDILIHLATHPGALVDQDALMRAGWPGRRVEPNNVSVQIAALRRALGDGGDGNTIIRTVPGRGYVFVADVPRMTLSRPDPRSGAVSAAMQRLPSAATRLVGRAAEQAEITRHLRHYRLVTITGTGGIGKTRLALHLAGTLAASYPDGTWFVDLSVLTNPDLVAEAVTTTLAIGSGERPAAERLISFLASRRVLLVLDNCEHVIDAVANLVTTLLRACPDLRILATSRESLFVPGESTIRLPPLPYPAERDDIDAAGAVRHDAVALFVERATTAVPGFVFDDAAAPYVARICASLEGIALAIEMAVSRLKVLTPAQLAERLTERLRLPVNPARGAPPRHRTLRAMIDWSYDLLHEDERALLCRMSLFSGGADLAAVLAVAAPADASEWDLLNSLTSLTEKSLLVVDATRLERRFRLLETIRQFADGTLNDGDRSAGRRCHASYFATLFETAEACWATTPTATWLVRYAPEVENLRAALDWSFGPNGDTALGLRLVAASYPLWWDLPQMPVPEGRAWFDRACRLITDSTPTAVAARLWLGASWRDMRYNDRDSLPAARQAASLFRQADDKMGLGGALWRVGATLFSGRNAAATRDLCTEAEQLLRPLGASKWLVMALIRIADTAMFERRLMAALPVYEEARAMADALDHWYGRLVSTTNMAELLYDLDRRDRAISLLEGLRDELSPRHRAPLLAPLVGHLLMAERIPDMMDTAREAIALAGMIGLASALGWVIEALALYLTRTGDTAMAARFAGFSRHVHPVTASRVGARRAILLQLQRALHVGLRPARRGELAATGAAWSEAQAMEHAMAVCTSV